MAVPTPQRRDGHRRKTGRGRSPRTARHMPRWAAPGPGSLGSGVRRVDAVHIGADLAGDRRQAASDPSWREGGSRRPSRCSYRKQSVQPCDNTSEDPQPAEGGGAPCGPAVRWSGARPPLQRLKESHQARGSDRTGEITEHPHKCCVSTHRESASRTMHSYPHRAPLMRRARPARPSAAPGAQCSLVSDAVAAPRRPPPLLATAAVLLPDEAREARSIRLPHCCRCGASPGVPSMVSSGPRSVQGPGAGAAAEHGAACYRR